MGRDLKNRKKEGGEGEGGHEIFDKKEDWQKQVGSICLIQLSCLGFFHVLSAKLTDKGKIGLIPLFYLISPF